MSAPLYWVFRQAVASALTACTCAASAQSAFVNMPGAGTDIVVTRLTPEIIQFTVQRDSYVRQLNSVAIVTARDVVLFDTATRPSSARIILAKLRTLTKKPVAIVINSHAHPDHWSGTEAFSRAFPGLEVIASQQTAAFMHLMAPVWPHRLAKQLDDRRTAFAYEKASARLADGTVASPDQLRHDTRDLADFESLTREQSTLTRVYPTIVYRDNLTLTHGGTAIELSAETGDQDGNTVAYLPSQKVLITGDLVSYPIPYINSRPLLQLQSLKRIDALDFAVLIPGHGPAMRNHDFLRLEIAFIQAAIDGVRHEVASGDGDLPTVQSRVKLEELRPALAHGDPDLDARFTSRVKDLVAFAFRELTGSGT